jgi:predicted Zn-dependent peptidase
VEAEVDAVSWSLTVPPEHLAFAMETLGAIAQRPRWGYAEFARARDQQMARASELAHHDGAWSALHVLHSELFGAPHPYATYDSTAEQLSKVSLADCQTWHRAHVHPDNASIVVAGGQAPESVSALVEAHFGSWKVTGQMSDGPIPPPPSVESRASVVHVVDQGKSSRALVLLGWVVPGAGTEEQAVTQVALGLLCGPRGRFVPTGKERISYCEARAYAGGIGVALVGVTTTPVGVPDAVERLNDALRELDGDPITSASLETDVRDLLGRSPRRWESSHGLARELTRLAVLDAPRKWPELEAQIWRETDGARTAKVVDLLLSTDRGVWVVTGDADRFVKPLSRFASIAVHAPSDFRTTKRLARDPSAT